MAKQNMKAARLQVEANNRVCAEIILRDIERYGGEAALPVRWARLALADDFKLTPAGWGMAA